MSWIAGPASNSMRVLSLLSDTLWKETSPARLSYGSLVHVHYPQQRLSDGSTTPFLRKFCTPARNGIGR
jgi:hypothetical protein